jgi:MoaA/NifB/PqqE/SkfB family radical SAM enzyme
MVNTNIITISFMPEQSIHDLTFAFPPTISAIRNGVAKFTINNSCQMPRKFALINLRGECYICGCESLLPVSVGDIESFQSIDEIWNNPVANILQEDIDSKKFTHCAVEKCGIMKRDINLNKYHISINIDESCNLRCPSCRHNYRMHTNGSIFDTALRRANHIVNLINSFDKPCDIIMSGNGDPLASLIMRPLVYDLRLKSDQTVTLFTNGLMMKHHLPKSSILSKITKYQISIDAGSKEVYEVVRLGGNFESLIENLDYLSTIVERPQCVTLFFCCQQKNYHDMLNFIELCKKYNFLGVISKLENWHTWSNGGIDKFDEHDVIGNTNHPEHANVFDLLTSIYNQFDKQYLSPQLQLLVERR